MAIIGIDLGTTNSLACIFRNGRTELIPNELGTYKTSSVVSLLEDGTVLVGAAAKERLISNPQSTAAFFKVWMGTERLIPLGGRSFARGAFCAGAAPDLAGCTTVSGRACGGGSDQCSSIF